MEILQKFDVHRIIKTHQVFEKIERARDLDYRAGWRKSYMQFRKEGEYKSAGCGAMERGETYVKLLQGS